jgi:hypothetical protein
VQTSFTSLHQLQLSNDAWQAAAAVPRQLSMHACCALLQQSLRQVLCQASDQHRLLLLLLLLQARLADVQRNGHCLSDGVGTISPLLLEEVLAALPFAPKQPAAATSSAIQVRSPDCGWLPVLLLAG